MEQKLKTPVDNLVEITNLKKEDMIIVFSKMLEDKEDAFFIKNKLKIKEIPMEEDEVLELLNRFLQIPREENSLIKKFTNAIFGADQLKEDEEEDLIIDFKVTVSGENISCETTHNKDSLGMKDLVAATSYVESAVYNSILDKGNGELTEEKIALLRRLLISKRKLILMSFTQTLKENDIEEEVIKELISII